jgi:lipoic acid synthetase
MSDMAQAGRRLPDWLKVKAPGSANYLELKRLVSGLGLHTVCESAQCPNIGECWNSRTATFMILGEVCTRSCGFCAVKTGRPLHLDEGEPARVAEAVAQLGLRHAVITSVNRDELPDGGARIFARTIEAVRRQSPQVTVEVLIPDFKGNWEALGMVLAAGPHLLNHNVETVPRLYPRMRPQAKYGRSLELLERARRLGEAPTKSGMMLGAGEGEEEIARTIADLAGVGCQILTLGQYLSPSPAHVPVDRFVHPGEFARWREFALAQGLVHVEAGPLVRSSYHAELQAGAFQGARAGDPASHPNPQLLAVR